MRRVTVALTEEEYNQFKGILALNGLTMSRYLKEIISQVNYNNEPIHYGKDSNG